MSAALHLAGFEVTDVQMTDLIEGRISLDAFQGIVFPGGFSFRDVFGAGKGWAELIRRRLWKMFSAFLARPDTFVLGVCNGCQVGAHLGLAPFEKYSTRTQPLFLQNRSRAFENRTATVKILDSKSIMFRGMEGSILSIPVANCEGRLWAPDDSILDLIGGGNLATLAYVDDNGEQTEEYPFNPSGSPFGWIGICDRSGRINLMMPHPERAFLPWQWSWTSDSLRAARYSPWMKGFINLRDWAVENMVMDIARAA